MKKVSIYRPTSIDEAIQILSTHGMESGVYAGGTDLLIRLKNRLKQAPTYLVDIKKIDHLRYIREDAEGGVEIGAATKLSELTDSPCAAQGRFGCFPGLVGTAHVGQHLAPKPKAVRLPVGMSQGSLQLDGAVDQGEPVMRTSGERQTVAEVRPGHAHPHQLARVLE